ncbi:MAG: SulP family inorganic anion transporter [Betaproteobacteria bacterium]|nr:SulP family inorganic anion transporter [Betaproteobacteria bacterium]
MPAVSLLPEWFSELRRPGVIRADLAAGLTGAVVVLPQALAFATLAGMPPQYGLYTAIVPCIIAALLGSSRLMVTGPANAISLTVLALLAPLATPGSAAYVTLAITLSFMVGVLQLAVGLTPVARLVDRVPHSVIIGFTAGAAVLIINSQVRTLLGLDWPRGLSVFETLAKLAHDIGKVHLPTAAVAGLTILVCVLAKPWNRRVPYMLVGVVGGGLGAAGLVAIGAGEGLAFTDELASALPPLSMPDLSPATLQMLAMPALVMTLLALAEAVSIARAIAQRAGQPLDGPREVRAQAFANLAGSAFSAYPASGSFNRSGVNIEAGAVTPLSAISAALLLMLVVTLVSPLARWLPLAAVAGVLLMVAVALIDLREIRAVAAEGAASAVSMAVTFALTVTVSLEWAILLGLLCHAVVVRLKR